MTSRHVVGVVCGVLLAAAIGSAQPARPVATLTPRVETAAVTPGSTVQLVLRVTLPEELHVQSNTPRDPALIPTVLTVEPPAGSTLVDITYPKAIDLVQSGAQLPLAVYPNEFDILVRVKLAADAAGALNVPARLRYQACNNSICFIPARAEAAWTVLVSAR